MFLQVLIHRSIVILVDLPSFAFPRPNSIIWPSDLVFFVPFFHPKSRNFDFGHEQRPRTVLPPVLLGTTGHALTPAGTTDPFFPVLRTCAKTAFQFYGFGHIFCIRTPFLVFFGSFRSYKQNLHHHCGRSIIHHHQNSWASTTLLQQRVKFVDERYNHHESSPLAIPL